jgi:hypothetical protein
VLLVATDEGEPAASGESDGVDGSESPAERRRATPPDAATDHRWSSAMNAIRSPSRVGWRR